MLFVGFVVAAKAAAMTPQALAVNSDYSGTLLTSLPAGRWLLSPVGAQTAEQLLLNPTTLSEDLPGQLLSFGYTNQELWLWFELTQQPGEPLLLQLGSSFLDRVDLYYLDQHGQLVTQQNGDHIPFFERPVLSRGLTMRLQEVSQPSTQAYLLRVQTGSAMTLRPSLMSPDRLLLQKKNSTLLYGILFGLSLLAALLALISWGWTRQHAFLTAALYSMVFAWFHFTINGFDQQYLYPNTPIWTDRLVGVSGFLAAALLQSLVQQFANVKQWLPRLNRLLSAWAVFYVVGAMASLAGAYPLLAPVLMLSGLLQTFVLLALMLYCLKRHWPVSLLLFLMLAPGCLAILLQVSRNLGLLPFNFWTSHLWAVSAMVQVVVLMVILLVTLNRAQQQLQQQLDENTAVQRFYQLMAHELRTPLAVVSSALTNLQWQTSAVPEAQPRIDRARMAVARLNNLVDNALAEDRLHLLAKGLQAEPVQLSEWLDELKNLCLVTEKHQLLIQQPEDSPVLWFDRQWLTLAVLNLLDNAVKYSPTGGSISLTVACYAEHWELVVCDQGLGVAKADQPRLFERGFRSKQHRAYSGLGLGLHLVEEVVQAHGGQVWYQPRPVGSCFQMQLPMHTSATGPA